MSEVVRSGARAELSIAEQLRRNRETLGALVDLAPFAVWAVDLEGAVTLWSQGAERIFGWTAEDVLGKPIPVIPSEQQAEFLEWLKKYPEGFRLESVERQRQHRDGTRIWTSISTAPQTDANGAIVGVIGVVIDLTAQRLTQKALRRSAERFRLLFAANPHPMWVYDAETLSFLEVNDAAMAQYGYSRDELLSMSVLDIRPATERERFLAQATPSGKAFRTAGEWRHLRKNGTTLDVEVMAHVIDFGTRPAVLVSAIDITERKRLEEQLRQSLKMEALGRLAGGVAHDFNNLLTIILGYSEVVGEATADNRKLHAMVGEIRQAGIRAAELTDRLLMFSRRQVSETKAVDLNEIVCGIQLMIRRLIPENIEVSIDCGPENLPVMGDRSQLEQVIVNLCVNARDAMPEGGTLRVETSRLDIQAEDSGDHATLEPGSYGMLLVSDTGTGMSVEVQAHLFEPFFTTKDAGRGTGLGLSMVYGVVRNHNGAIDVDSVVGQGSTFRVCFPLTRQPHLGDTALPVTFRSASGTETVLVVEDQDGVRRLMVEALRDQGYHVLEANTGTEGLRLLEDLSDRIDILVSDVVLPGINGLELVEHGKRLHPTLRFLFTSGYTGDLLCNSTLSNSPGSLLEKPFTTKALTESVRKALDGPPGAL